MSDMIFGIMGFFLILGVLIPCCIYQLIYIFKKKWLAVLGVILYFPCIFFLSTYNNSSNYDGEHIASVRRNMHNFQTILETYSIDANGNYPKNVEELKKFATNGKNEYWKDFKSPFTNQKGKGNSYDDISNVNKKIKKTITHFFTKDSYVLQGRPGVVYYAPVIESNGIYSGYCIYGSNKEGELITVPDSGIAFALSNN